MTEPTPDKLAQIVALVLAGAQPTSAAATAGVDRESFEQWCRDTDLGDRISAAQADARTATEIELRQKSPRAWLQNRYAATPEEKAEEAKALVRPRPLGWARRKRDESVRRLIGKLRREASYLSEPRYAPLLKSYCELTVLISRGYARVREGDLISATTGELRASLDTLLRMYATQGRLARELGLTPTVAATMAKPVSMLDLESLRDAETVDE